MFRFKKPSVWFTFLDMLIVHVCTPAEVIKDSDSKVFCCRHSLEWCRVHVVYWSFRPSYMQDLTCYVNF